MHVEDLNEPISVRAYFSGGKILPQAFRRGERVYSVTRVNAQWTDREDAHPIHYFSVQAGDETYYLSLRSGEMLWRLEKVILDG